LDIQNKSHDNPLHLPSWDRINGFCPFGVAANWGGVLPEMPLSCREGYVRMSLIADCDRLEEVLRRFKQANICYSGEALVTGVE